MLLLISNRHAAYLVNNNLKTNLVFYSLFLRICSLRLTLPCFAVLSIHILTNPQVMSMKCLLHFVT